MRLRPLAIALAVVLAGSPAQAQQAPPPIRVHLRTVCPPLRRERAVHRRRAPGDPRPGHGLGLHRPAIGGQDTGHALDYGAGLSGEAVQGGLGAGGYDATTHSAPNRPAVP